jgi:signal transduction histidine kinase
MSTPPSSTIATPAEPKTGSHAWLKGETGALIRTIDWSRHPMGPIESWPQSLRTALSICLGSDFPMALWWGPEVWQLYNDGYIPVLGGKHPLAMGQHGNVCWAEIWEVVGPIYERVMTTGESSFFSDLLLVMERNHYVEETYFTFSYSPVLDEQGGVGGNLIICTETTEQVVGERRLRTLRDLGARAAEGKSAAEACAIAAETLAANLWDIPFACIYLLNGEGGLELAGSAGVEAGCPVSPASLEVMEAASEGWSFAEVIKTSRICRVDDLAKRFSEVPASPWKDRTRSALVLPLSSPGQERPTGVLVVGVNPRRALDESYHGFFQLAAGQLAAAIADARAYEEERRRAEALAELDRAKTTFFSNVSHEFRTPLTLLLGPLEDALNDFDDGTALLPAHRERVETAHRNALRLLKLVNTLLDFARIEAGRVQAVYEPIDLAAYTAELASVFRSAVERAGLRFTVDCPPLLPGRLGGITAYVDREMWEKVVLNLLSNALKFTLDGEIAVRLRAADGGAADGGERLELSISDTGVGIPQDELPRVFERFRRVRVSRARSQEGTGIGLALVQELVRLHGGEVRAESEPGFGTTFTVSIPAGSDHLPEDRLGSARTVTSTTPGAAPYVEEALRWLPDAPSQGEETAAIVPAAEARILLVDDNADIREYVRRLLGNWTVETAADGTSALLSALASPPDLVLTDVMMPGLDGFELLRALRSHPRTATVPVILLSARAGEEARVEGLQAGADDYLVKPFSARELVARVGAHLATTRLRQQVAARERAAREEAEAAGRAKDEFLAMLSHELRNPIGAITNAAHALSSMPTSGERMQRLTQIVARQSTHLTRLLDDLLDVARVTAGKIELRRRPVDLAEIAERCSRGDGSHRLEMQVEPAWVEGDPTRLEQVLTNLVENAFKYTPQGGTIRIEVGPDGHEAVLRVRDTGVGISSDILPKVFDLFVQGERSLDRVEGGLGIGLTLVRRLVELHGGKVEARSGGRGQGSELEVRLPLLAPPLEEGEVPARSSRSARRVLIIEDNPDAREALQMLLELEGHEVETAADGPAGVELAGRFLPDLILLDIGLPGENGYEVARRLAEHPARSRMHLVALTGYGQENDHLLSREAGFDLHLVKPLELARLRELLAGL